MAKVELNWENMVEFFKSLTSEQKAEIREILEIKPTIGTTAKVRTNGKFIRTDKVYENNLNKQMSVLIKSLPTDKGVSVEDWAKLAIENNLETQQDPVRIVQYYRKNLLEMGFVKASE